MRDRVTLCPLIGILSRPLIQFSFLSHVCVSYGMYDFLSSMTSELSLYNMYVYTIRKEREITPRAKGPHTLHKFLKWVRVSTI